MSTIIVADKGEIQQLTELNSRLKEENELLKIRVKELEEKLNEQNSFLTNNTTSKISKPILQKPSNKVLSVAIPKNKDLNLAEYLRYGRQLILPGFGKSGAFFFSSFLKK